MKIIHFIYIDTLEVNRRKHVEKTESPTVGQIRCGGFGFATSWLGTGTLLVLIRVMIVPCFGFVSSSCQMNLNEYKSKPVSHSENFQQ